MTQTASDGVRILVVDDETVIARSLAAILRHHGYQTAIAYDGESAVEAARSFQPHCIVSDVVMPGLNGIDAAVRILGFLPGCKIILISGQALSPGLIAAEAQKSGHNFPLLAKPIHPADLLARISALLK